MRKTQLLLLSLLTLGVAFSAFSQKDLMYQSPPKAIADLVDAPQTPAVSLDSEGEWMLLLERPGYPSIDELAQPELKLAGLRINPSTYGGSRAYSYHGLKLKKVKGGEEFSIRGLPENARIENISWSPDDRHIVFTHTTADGIELWKIDVASRQAKKLTDARINDAMRGTPYEWFPDGKSLLVKVTPAEKAGMPKAAATPAGPVIQETSGTKAPARTYQDLLNNQYDEDLFKHYTQVQLMRIDLNSGMQKAFGQPGIIPTFEISPNGEYVLLGTIKEPFSYLVPYSRFPIQYTLHSQDGKLVRSVADIPLAENIPTGFGAVREGPRSFTWRADAPATLYWVEAQDGGDPNAEADVRDRLYYLEAPFKQQPQPGIDFGLRYGGVDWGDDDLAVAYEWWWSTRERIVSRFDPDDANSKQTLFTYSSEDRYNNPGGFVMTTNKAGRSVLLIDDGGETLYLTGAGASPKGNRPFLREFDLDSGETKELWRSTAPYYEYPVQLIDADDKILITRRESRDDPPNYFLRDLERDKVTAITDFPHPYPGMKGVEKQVLRYERKDGVPLQGDLYLPPGYDPEKDGRLPVIMWAYPDEFKSADAAGQVKGSPYEFIRLYWGSPLYWVTQGYAVLDDPGMPVIGEGEEEPNDNFRQQLVDNAAAAIDKLVDMGIADRDRVAIGGHSYGAFMTANLLAHSDLFAAGIARSGAYNRTLTPFGFQAEERTYWEAPDVYYTMSPFMHADKVNEPILLIHGEADNNSGTFPIQSKRFYAAIKGQGGTARLVMLPHESHGYRARESILHTLWEQHQWLEKYVKNRKTEKVQPKP